jgi:hypothetical protein
MGLSQSCHKLSDFTYFLKIRYKLYVWRYIAFARSRGFKSFNDRLYHIRGFISCWAEPGFHKFWQVWNPGIAYFIYRFYFRVGGRKHWILPTFISFVFCGFAHTVIVLPFFKRWSYSVIGAFACFGLLTIINRYLEPLLKQEKWPSILNVLVNAGLVIISFDVGFHIDSLLSSLF